MNIPDHTTYDVIIAGSGFAGSLTGLLLHQSGFKVCIIEKRSHPRFAIGESSTPAADMILRKLADDYHLPWLKHLSRYGSWQQHYPEIVCGLKRGFSYYQHQKGDFFKSNEKHTKELHVAASRDDVNSDTNWLRADFDSFLIYKVKEYGITYSDNTSISHCVKNNADAWQITVNGNDGQRVLSTPLLIDATGSSSFLKRFLHTDSSSDGFETCSMALYSHFDHVTALSDYLSSCKSPIRDYPYDPDHAALHHLIDEGWIWMLRFNTGLLSAGIVLDLHTMKDPDPEKPEALWKELISRYPSVSGLFSRSSIAEIPGKIMVSGRLQRKAEQMYGDGWIALNHSAGFVDPLHSTGIAHALSGIEKTVRILNETRTDTNLRLTKLKSSSLAFGRELYLMDLLTAGCYQARKNFRLFSAYSMLYFTCTLQYEHQRLQGDIPSHFLSADETSLVSMIEIAYQELQDVIQSGVESERVNHYIQRIRNMIEPYNRAGLLNESKNNIYRHTAIDL